MLCVGCDGRTNNAATVVMEEKSNAFISKFVPGLFYISVKCYASLIYLLDYNTFPAIVEM